MRAILNIPNCLGGCPIALEPENPRAPIPVEVCAQNIYPVFEVQVRITLSPGHTGKYDGEFW